MFTVATAFVTLLTGLLIEPAVSQSASQYFQTTMYRSPTQCERDQCLSPRSTSCQNRVIGYSNMQKGCSAGQICTNCVYGNLSFPTTCLCENPPYSVSTGYNTACNSGVTCSEGMCFRPCNTYLHVTLCPQSYCTWNLQTLICESSTASTPIYHWLSASGLSITAQAEVIVASTTDFPESFSDFQAASAGFQIQGTLLSDISPLQTIFSTLDTNFDGYLQKTEFVALPALLAKLSSGLPARAAKASAMARLLQNASERQLQGAASPQVCSLMSPRQYYCSFDASCKLNCKECGWKSATDTAYSQCVVPSPSTCFADSNKVYCPSDQLCHLPGDCSSCVDRPAVDYVMHACSAIWWGQQPLTDSRMWVCRYRNKVGMPCKMDQDCIYGLRRCLNSKCAGLEPYNPNQTCASDYDCPYLGYYCPKDPTGGENPYWVQFCRTQRSSGETCQDDRECKPDLRCNLAEAQPRCRQLFSLTLGAPANLDELCTSGWRDRFGLCALAALSKQVGRSCSSDLDCVTTDASGRTGQCSCKAWWDQDESSYCQPVAGDYTQYQQNLRAYLWFRSQNCGRFWTEQECLTIFSSKAKLLKLKVDCETQQLSGGPYLPPSSCGLSDPTTWPDYCAQLAAL